MRGRTAAAVIMLMLLVTAGCGAPSPSPSARATVPASTPGGEGSTTAAPSTSAPTAGPTEPPAPAASGAFAFAADDILAYYASQGFGCSDAQPSTTAAGYVLRTCVIVDEGGRTLTIGLITDATGAIGDAYASVQAPEDEAFLAPTDALDPFAGFLGALLGEEAGADLLTWLAGHLGDVYAETTSGAIKVATFAESETDRGTLYLELADDAYLSAPAP